MEFRDGGVEKIKNQGIICSILRNQNIVHFS